MYKVCRSFSQVLKLFPRGEFESAVEKHKAERHARGFTSWGQFTAMPDRTGALVARDLRGPGVLRRLLEAPGSAHSA